MLLYKFPFGPLDTNAILIGCSKTKKCAVIDPAMGSAQALIQQASRSNLKIEAILLTHSHWDHFADAHKLKEITKAPLSVHSLDQENVENPGSDHIPLFFHVHSVAVDHLIEDGQVLEVGALELRVLHTPGHSPGSVCFYLHKERVLISGDTLFRGSVGNLHLPTSNPDQMWKSLRKLAQLPPETRVVPGHGADTTIQAEPWLERANEIFS